MVGSSTRIMLESTDKPANRSIASGNSRKSALTEISMTLVGSALPVGLPLVGRTLRRDLLGLRLRRWRRRCGEVLIDGLLAGRPGQERDENHPDGGAQDHRHDGQEAVDRHG